MIDATLENGRIINEGIQPDSWQALVDFFYVSAPEARRILLDHSRAVARLALRLNALRNVGLDEARITFSAMTHDIGIVATQAPGIGCNGSLPYICHGPEGARMLRGAGAPEWAARVAERHTGAGIMPADIERQSLPLSTEIEMCPQTPLEQIICYADKFFSKKPGHLDEIKSLEKVRSEMSRHGQDTLQRFEALHCLYGHPDVIPQSQ